MLKTWTKHQLKVKNPSNKNPSYQYARITSTCIAGHPSKSIALPLRGWPIDLSGFSCSSLSWPTKLWLKLETRLISAEGWKTKLSWVHWAKYPKLLKVWFIYCQKNLRQISFQRRLCKYFLRKRNDNMQLILWWAENMPVLHKHIFIFYYLF